MSTLASAVLTNGFREIRAAILASVQNVRVLTGTSREGLINQLDPVAPKCYILWCKFARVQKWTYVPSPYWLPSN